MQKQLNEIGMTLEFVKPIVKTLFQSLTMYTDNGIEKLEQKIVKFEKSHNSVEIIMEAVTKIITIIEHMSESLKSIMDNFEIIVENQQVTKKSLILLCDNIEGLINSKINIEQD